MRSQAEPGTEEDGVANNQPCPVTCAFLNVLVVQDVIALDGLPIKDAGAPDAGGFQVLGEIAMDQSGQIESACCRWDK